MSILSSLFGLFGCKDSSDSDLQNKSGEVYVTAQLNHLLMPLDRGDRYEDPLNAALKDRGFGETGGGGTAMSEAGQIEYIDVEITLTNLSEGVPFVIEQLEKFGAPKGSVLIIHDTKPPRKISFGKIEGVAIYIDGVNLPDEVYESSDINVIIDDINKKLNGKGSMQGSWEGQKETALYFYGDDAEEMKELISGVMGKYPLLTGARVVTIASKGID